MLTAVGDGIYWHTAVPPGKEFRAALAIRDNVTPFQKWGSEVFTLRYLKRYYGGAWYFTQSKKGDLEKEITSCLDNALEHYSHVDLYLLAHTNEYIQWVARLPEERRQRLRLVYNTGCYNQSQGPAGSGTFTPNATTLNATYTPAAADASTGSVTLTLTSTGQPGPCAASAQVVVTIPAAATASAGGNQTICSGHSTAGLGGTVGGGATGGMWSSSGAGTFAPNATTLNASYSPIGRRSRRARSR